MQEYVAGIKITSYNGKTWQVLPQPGNLISVAAGFQTHLGSFDSEWTVGDNSFTLTFNTPEGTEGVLGVPTFVDQGRIGIQFKVSDANGDEIDISGLAQESDKYFSVVRGIKGGSYRVDATYSKNARVN